ncbi:MULTISPECIES: TauD/TfdA dioxygenase family protein [Streptomyces]|uniref:TauD/TfdA dioxygenase family protein n=1 Tax=Streptomyces TaxID=1883 RepID=UPI00358E179E
MTCPNHCGGWPTACGPSTPTTTTTRCRTRRSTRSGPSSAPGSRRSSTARSTRWSASTLPHFSTSLEAGGPPSGERGLFISGFAQRIVGLSLGESRKLLDLLRSYVTRPENVLRHRWSENQLVVFDNRITQHYAIDNYDGLPRRLHRVTVAGDVPAGIEGTESHSVEGDASHYTSMASQPVPVPVAA